MYALNKGYALNNGVRLTARVYGIIIFSIVIKFTIAFGNIFVAVKLLT